MLDIQETPQKNIVGIYSFPKSGNTWVRSIVANLFGQNISNFKKYIPDIYQDRLFTHPLCHNNIEFYCYKSHQKFEMTSARQQEFNNDCIIYIIRNPLSVFTSQLNYLSANVTNQQKFVINVDSIEHAVEANLMESLFHAFMIFGTLQPGFIGAGSWFENAEYWLQKSQEKESNVIFLRYEDLVDAPAQTFKPVIEYLGFNDSDLDRALEKADQDTRNNGGFFWKRSKSSYKEYLNNKWIDQFTDLHEEKLKLLGYTDL